MAEQSPLGSPQTWNSSSESDLALVVGLCGRDPDPALERSVIAVASSVDARARLLRLAAAHRVAGIVVGAMARAADVAPPDAPWGDAIRDIRLRMRRRTALIEIEWESVFAAVRRAGIEPVVLKGAALTNTVYEDPDDRDILDLDLLVGPADLKTALRSLKNIGYALGPLALLRVYRRHHFHVPLHREDFPPVEIHWALARPDFPFRLDPAEVMTQATPLGRGPWSSFLAPRPEHMVLHLVLQNAQESFSRLSRIVDLDRLLTATPSLDWDLLIRLARRSGLEHATSLSLRLAEVLLGTAVPARVSDELRGSSLARFHIAALDPVSSLLQMRFDRSHVMGLLLRFWLLPGWPARCSLLRDVVTRSPVVPSGKGQQGGPARLAALSKMVLCQGALLALAAASAATRGGRSQIRFWSSQARSSARL